MAVRSLKYECVYLHAFETGSEAKIGIGKWITFYNEQRLLSSLDDKMSDEVYCRNSGAGSPVPVDPQAAWPKEPYTLNSL
ncbi:MAG: integrase core domain-containing protein [Candidatus Deferrimicrobiaceae bacterium]